MADTLIRETAPPAGAPASPVPQVWNPATSSYEKVEGSEGAPKMRADDGKIATLGAKADAAVTDPTLSASEIALLKGLLKQLQGTGPVITPVLQYGSNANQLAVDIDGVLPVTGTYALELLYEPQLLNIPTYEGSGQAVHPDVVYIPEGFGGYKYWMAFTPYPNGNNEYENPSIVASNDGITWVVPAGLTNPLAAYPGAGSWNADPQLIYIHSNTTLYLYWQRYGTGASMYRRTSIDGVTWTDPVAVTSLGQAAIIAHDSNDWVAYTMTSIQNSPGIKRWVSSDGITWVSTATIPMSTPGKPSHISVYHDVGGYHFLVSTYLGPTTSNFTELLYGYSPNGIDIYWNPAPLLMPTENKWYSQMVYHSCITHFGKSRQYRLFISGRAIDNTWRIGYVDARIVFPRIMPVYQVGPSGTNGRHSLVRAKNVTVNAGATYTLASQLDLRSITKICAGVYHTDAAHNYMVAYDETGTENAFKFQTALLGNPFTPTDPGSRVLSSIMDVRALYGSFFIKNQDSISHTYNNIEIIGW